MIFKPNQNAFVETKVRYNGSYVPCKVNTTMTKLTVVIGRKEFTAGVSDPKFFDYDSLLGWAMHQPEISV